MDQSMNHSQDQTEDQLQDQAKGRPQDQIEDQLFGIQDQAKEFRGRGRTRLRLGKLSYFNNAPMYYGLTKNHPHITGCYKILEGPPSYLNQCIRQKEIDLTAASSIVYAQNFEHYLILPNLSISSDGPVQSVLLLSRVPIERLDKQLLLLSSDSETSVALIKIIMSRQGISPVYIRGQVPDMGNGNQHISSDLSALLVIGDRALQVTYGQSSSSRSFPFVYDLGEEWKKMTGLPFVFALWMVRQESFDQNGELVFQLWQALCESRDYSLTHPEELVASVQTPADLPKAICIRYIQQDLRYELSSRYQEGLRLYYHFLYELGEIPQPVQALKFVNSDSMVSDRP